LIISYSIFFLEYKQFYAMFLHSATALITRPQSGIIFSPSCSKTYNMPNSANKSKGGSNANAGQGAPRHQTSNDSAPKSNPERSDLKHGDHDKDRGDNTGRTSNQGRKEASGGSAND
jgi:hypothetical protein